MSTTSDTAAAEHELAGYDAGTRTLPLVTAAALAGLTVAAAWLTGWPAWATVLAAVAGAGLGYLAVLDARTMLVLNRHNAVFLAVALAGLIFALAVTGSPLRVAFGVASGLAVFCFLVGITLFSGIAGGGDLKLVASPAMLMGAWLPMTPLYWMTLTFALALGCSILHRVRTRRGLVSSARVPMVPLMAWSLVPTVAVTGILARYAGLT